MLDMAIISLRKCPENLMRADCSIDVFTDVDTGVRS
jgi:hypothetical protein